MRVPLGVLALTLPLLASCELPYALAPRGPAAAEITRLWWILFWTATVVSLIVFTLLFVALYRARRARHGQWQEGQGTAFVLVGGGIIPALILTAMTFKIYQYRIAARPISHRQR
jgi:cytochrome c oxidase subunit II